MVTVSLSHVLYMVCPGRACVQVRGVWAQIAAVALCNHNTPHPSFTLSTLLLPLPPPFFLSPFPYLPLPSLTPSSLLPNSIRSFGSSQAL